MEMDVLEKYKLGAEGDYSLVYESGDRSYGDLAFQKSSVLESVEVSMSDEDEGPEEMDSKLEKILDTYSGEDDDVSPQSYGGAGPSYSSLFAGDQAASGPADEDDEAETPKSADLSYECASCEKVFKLPGICDDCKVVLSPHSD